MKRNCLIAAICITLMALVLVPCAVFADDDAIVYDAADFPCYSGRTMQDVMQKYTEATAKGDTYIDSQRGVVINKKYSFNPLYNLYRHTRCVQNLVQKIT